MASGTLGNTFQTGYRIQIDWVSTPNPDALTSKVMAKMYLVTSQGYNIITSMKKDCRLKINSSESKYSVDTNVGRPKLTKLLATKELTVSHNQDTGKATVSLGGSLGINATLSGKYFGTVSISTQTFNLDTIETCQFHVATGGSQVKAKGVYCGTGGTWKKVPVYVGTNGGWKKVSS